MKTKRYSTPIRKQLEASVRNFQAIATETEVVLSGQHLVDSLKKRARRSKRRTANPPDLTRTMRAFALARKRREALKPVLAEAGVNGVSSTLAIGSVDELVRRANDTERAFDDVIAQGPHTDDEFLPPDGSGDGLPPLPPLPPPGEGGGGVVPDPVSFDQYPLDVQTQAQSAYDLEVAPGAELAVQSGSSSFTNFCIAMGIDPNFPPTEPFPQGTLDALAQGARSIFNDMNNTIAGIVAAAAFSLGGPVGGGLAALAILLVPRMLDAFEEFVENLFK